MENVFGFSDDAGKRLIIISNPEAFNPAIGNTGIGAVITTGSVNIEQIAVRVI